MSTSLHLAPIPQGKTVRATVSQPIIAGSESWIATTDADAVLVSLYVTSLSGTLDLEVYTQTDDGKDLLVASFPQVTSPTSNLLIKKAATIISLLKIVATYSAACNFEIYLRGVSGAESSVRVLGATEARVTKIALPATTTLLIPAALTDRAGLVIKNNNGTAGASFYFGFSPTEATVADGFPIAAQESLAMDVSSGVEIYAISASGTTDIRLIESGS